MTRNEMIEALANYYGIDLEDDEDGGYNLNNYKFENGRWLSLKEIVWILKDFCVEDEEEDF